MKRFLVGIVLGIVNVVGIAQPARAIIDNWNNNVGGSYTLNTNWTDASNPANHVVPGANDFAVFNRNLNIAYEVTFPGRPIVTPLTREVLGLDVGTNTVSFSDSVNFNQLPAAFSVNPNNGLSFGTTIGGTSGQIAVLNTTLASFSTNRVAIGSASGAMGTLNVNGGTFNVTTSFEDLHEFVIGASGDGTLSITSGAHVNVTGDVVLGQFESGNGTATVSGAGSTWAINGDLELARLSFRMGTLTVAAGGTMSSNSAVSGASGAITVTGAGSTWTNAHDITWGGRLMIEDGGHVASGSADVDVGSGSAIGGRVSVVGTGSNWTVNGDLVVGATASPVPSYVYPRLGGTISVSGLLTVQSSGLIQGDGTVAGNVANGGLVAPSADAGGIWYALHVSGDYTQSAAGKLELELGGTNPSTNFDRLLVDGAVTFNGTLQVLLASSFLPVGGNSFKILDWTDGRTGVFSSLDLQALYGGLTWDTTDLYVTGTLSVGGILGDYNVNGVVDAADYVVWRKTLGLTGAGLAADGNGNKQIDSGDFDVWRNHFGQTAGGGAGAHANATIPEPPTMVMLIVTTAGVFSLRRPAYLASVKTHQRVRLVNNPPI